MKQNIYIQDYSGNSFVVRGETLEYKDSLKSLGGKWNSRLTDKDSGEVFSAWIFWNGKRKDLDIWFKKRCPKLENNQTEYKQQDSTNNSNIQLNLNFQRLESKVDNLTKLLEQLSSIHVCGRRSLCKSEPAHSNLYMNKLKKSSDDDDYEQEYNDKEYSTKPRKRLLSKNINN